MRPTKGCSARTPECERLKVRSYPKPKQPIPARSTDFARAFFAQSKCSMHNGRSSKCVGSMWKRSLHTIRRLPTWSGSPVHRSLRARRDPDMTIVFIKKVSEGALALLVSLAVALGLAGCRGSADEADSQGAKAPKARGFHG